MSEDTTPKMQIQPVIMAILAAALGAIATWSLKLEDRIYNIAITRVTQQQLHETEARLKDTNVELKAAIQSLVLELRDFKKELRNK